MISVNIGRILSPTANLENHVAEALMLHLNIPAQSLMSARLNLLSIRVGTLHPILGFGRSRGNSYLS